MAVQLSEKAVVVKGHDECVHKSQGTDREIQLAWCVSIPHTCFLLSRFHYSGLLPLEYIEEVTYDEETGYFRVKQRSKSSHKFALADKLVSYADEVKGYLQPNRIKNLSGVHAKEFFFWVPIGDISVDEPPTGKIHFKSYAGLGDSFSVEAFAPGQ
ncbi:unnamed protein product [Sphagnum jensenii]|uniref:Uncharacterized protein n=1 Tax=Sphagnum jensenii TaxID=128206 RepID=A0ABP0VNT0_9BRYO